MSALISVPPFSSCTNEARVLGSRQIVLPCPSSLLRPGDSLSATWHFRGSPVIDRLAPAPQGRGRAGPLQFPRHPSDRSTSPTPEGPSPPAPRTRTASMAFTKSTQARHPHVPGHPGAFTTLQTSLDAADRPVAPPRFDPGLSTGPGGFATGDLGISPDRTFTGWLTRATARLRHDRSVALIAPGRAAGRRWIQAQTRPSMTTTNWLSPAGGQRLSSTLGSS